MILKIAILLLALPVLADDVVVVAPTPVVIPGPMPKILDVALPVNPHVVGGAATVAFTPDTMTVTPSTNRTWIQYDSFDVGKNATVCFQQGPGNLTVNEVTGSKMSEIAGRIHVTDGAIVLMNRNGQIFKDGAILDGNIMVSTVPLNQQAFMNSGKLLFESAGLLGQKPRVTVGSVKASGLSVFIAPWFEALGLFTGNLHVFSGESVSLSLCGNTLARFEVQGALKDSLLHVAEGSEIEGQQVVLHTGHMEDVMDSTIKVDGSLKAQDIMVVGNEITLSETSSLDVGGDTGGTIRLGVDQDYDLKDPKRFDHVLAQNITIKEGAKLLAPGEDQGGTIYTFAKNKGDYKGTYDISSAKGPGGLLELSVKKNLMLPTILNLKASGGAGQKAGTLLLDPDTVNIDNVGGGGGGLAGATVHDSAINNALLAANVTITADTSITGANGSTIHWNSANTLTLRAPTIAVGGLIDMENPAGNATLNLLASTGFTMAGGTIKMYGNTVNITSPALITGNLGLIDQRTPGAPTKIRVTGPGFSTVAPVVGFSIDDGVNITPITDANYTLETTGTQTPANVPPQFDGKPTAGSPVSAVTTSSGNVILDQRIAQIQSLYLALLGRGADPEGLNFWVTKMQSKPLKSVVESFLADSQLRNMFRDKTTAQVVDIVASNMGYTNPAGLVFWKSRFNNTGDNSVDSASVAQVLIEFISSVSQESNATGVAWAAKVQAAIAATAAAQVGGLARGPWDGLEIGGLAVAAAAGGVGGPLNQLTPTVFGDMQYATLDTPSQPLGQIAARPA